jgi:putative ABC transport system permease protein
MVNRMRDEVAGIPSVRGAAIAAGSVMKGWGFGLPLEFVGRPAPDSSNRVMGGFKAVTPSYFQTLGLKLLRGRLLKETDSFTGPRTMVINESFAKRYYSDSEPIGQYIAFNQIVTGKREIGPRTVWEIVGVVSDEVVDLEREDHSLGYVTFDQNPLVGFGLVVRGQGDPRQLVKSIQAALTRVDPNQAITDVKLVDQIKSESTGQARLRTLILGGFAGLALLLAAVGIYGVVAYSVTQRTRELGIRAALGASRGSLLGLALGGSVRLAAVGLLAGIAGVQWTGRLLSTLLFHTSGTEVATLAAVAAVLLAVTLIASFLPARRAARIDPVVALRHE